MNELEKFDAQLNIIKVTAHKLFKMKEKRENLPIDDISTLVNTLYFFRETVGRLVDEPTK